MKKEITAVGVTFTFDGLDTVTFDATKCTSDVRDYAMRHGFSARIGDNAALSRKQPDGTVIKVTEEMRRAEVVKLVEHYHNGGGWEMGRSAAQNPVIAAIAAKRGCTYAEAEKLLADQFLAD